MIAPRSRSVRAMRRRPTSAPKFFLARDFPSDESVIAGIQAGIDGLRR
jgi:hypothetical protein